MLYDVQWYKEPVVLYVRHEGILTPDKIVRAEETIFSYLHDARRPVHVMVDVTRMTGVDCNLREVEQLDIVQRVSEHPRRGLIVAFDNYNPAYTFMATVAGKRMRDDVQVVDSEREAVEFLRHVDNRLEFLEMRQLSRTG